MELVVEGVTGAVGGCVGRSAAFPFDTLKTKLATQSETGKKGALALIRQVLEEEGILGFYRGLLPYSAFEAFVQKGLYVFIYNYLKQLIRRLSGREPTVLGALLCGYLADLSCIPICMPLEVLVVRLQAAAADASKADLVRDTLFTWEGLTTAWRSGKVYIILSLKPGVEFPLYDRVKDLVLKRASDSRLDLTSGEGFAVGAIARASATLIFFPYQRAKAIAQARLAPNAKEALGHILRTEGPLGLYRGLYMELMRGVFQAAVMFMVMERVRGVVRKALLK